MAGLFQKVCGSLKGNKWTYGSSGAHNIDNVRLSTLQAPSQYIDEGDIPPLPKTHNEAKSSTRLQISAEPDDALSPGLYDHKGHEYVDAKPIGCVE